MRLGTRNRNRARSGRFRRPNRYAISTAIAEKIRAALKASGGIKLKTHIVVTEKPAFAANVVGLLEGSDSNLSHEIVGIGSHLDHIGARGDRINNGADDDGSGTTGVLAVARAFAKNPKKPRRSLLFMCFAGEERGMVGSGFYANNPIFPNEEMVVELQMDMIGRNEEFVNRRTGEVTEKAEDNVNTLHLIGSEKLSKAEKKWNTNDLAIYMTAADYAAIRRMPGTSVIDFATDKEVIEMGVFAWIFDYPICVDSKLKDVIVRKSNPKQKALKAGRKEMGMR